jgi:hypothetical protein
MPEKKQLGTVAKTLANSPWDPAGKSKMVLDIAPFRRLINYRAFPIDQFLLFF